ncbi:MAG: hypothetical protein KAW01_06505 [Deltaproteobacteria bacterium]|nr:hypothetical protein [Deltaproteobacteria bacterium]
MQGRHIRVKAILKRITDAEECSKVDHLAARRWKNGEKIVLVQSVYSLLSRADVEAVVGEAFKNGRPGRVFFPAGKSCKYFSEGNMGGTSVNLQVYWDKDVAAEGLYASAAEAFARQEKSLAIARELAEKVLAAAGCEVG